MEFTENKKTMDFTRKQENSGVHRKQDNNGINKETRKEGSKTTESNIHSSLRHLHMHNMWQGLPIKDWALQPPKAM